MTSDLLSKTHALISQSQFTQELTDFSAWLSAEHYTPVIIHSHLSRLDRILPPMPRNEKPNAHGIADLETVFDVGRRPPSRIKVFQATCRAYARFLQVHGRLLEPQADNPFGALRRKYNDYLSEARGLSLSSRTHHGFQCNSVLEYPQDQRYREKSSVERRRHR